MNKKKLKITLKSDLCVGSGYSYAGIIDSDICYDEYGIPYIPAKRLKGVLREAAELINIKDTDIGEIFGTVGKALYNTDGTYVQKGIRLGNAYIKDYKKIYGSLRGLEEKYRKYITPQSVLEQFTVIKAQTKIEAQSGVAEDNTLRFTRAVKHYSPFDNEKEMEFIAEIKLLNLADAYVENLEKIVKAVRNIGLNRNRGMGSVVCTLVDGGETYAPKVDLSQITKDNETYILSYRVRNTAPLVLNVGNNYETERYINGQSVLGYFAAAYLRAGNEAKEEFSDLFLKNKVIFSGLYPSEGERVFYPAPSYIKCLKRTKEYVDTSYENLYKTNDDSDSHEQVQNNVESGTNQAETNKADKNVHSIANGNMPKKLKGKFVYLEDTKPKFKIQVKEVETDIVYHHTKKSDRQESVDGELLYPFEVVRAQQTFSGTIIGEGKYIRKIGRLLAVDKLQFGKSKSSQYGTCILDGAVQIKKVSNKKKTYRSRNKILVTLQSDGIFMNENGYTVQYDDVKKAIVDVLTKQREKSGTNTDKEDKSCIVADGEYCEIESRKLVGFYSKWNLKRQAIPVICAGSTFEFELNDSITVGEDGLYVGERNGEGYGKLTIIEKNETDYLIDKLEKVKPNATELSGAIGLCKMIILRKMRETLNGEAIKIEKEIKNSSTLGRITLMLTESINQHPDDMGAAYSCFEQKIRSIKDKDKREAIVNIKDELICKGEFKYDSLRYTHFKDSTESKESTDSTEFQSLIDIYKEIQMIEKQAELEREIENMWGGYFMNYLNHENYRHQKERERKNERDKTN